LRKIGNFPKKFLFPSSQRVTCPGSRETDQIFESNAQVRLIIEGHLFSLYEAVSLKMNNETLKNLEFIQMSGYLRAYKTPITYVPIRHLYNSRENFTNPPLFMQNKPNFPRFSLKNEDFTKKTNPIQTQFKPNQSQF